MSTESGKPLIVTSYAHADEPEHPAEGEVKWLSFVTGYLRPAIKHLAVDLWTDWRIPGGADWEREIEQKLRACDVFLVLVSTHSLSSDYIVDKEIPIIRQRQAKGEAVHFYPLVLTPTPNIALDLVRDKNLRPREGKPFSDFSINDRYRHMSEIADEIVDISTKIARGKGGPPQRAGMRRKLQVKDPGSLEEWLAWQSPEATVALAVRAAMRVLPSGIIYQGSSDLAGIVFRAVALARATAKYPRRANEFLATAIDAAGDALAAADFAQGSADALARAAHAAVRAAAYSATALTNREDRAAVVDAAVDVAASAADVAFENPRGAGAADDIWREIRSDALAMREEDVYGLVDLPLWSRGVPRWASDDWKGLKALLPSGEGWKVWIDWYDKRLRGGSQNEACELVFASVPRNLWDKDPAAANEWVREHLPKVLEISTEASLPPPVVGLASPFAYGWNASLRVADVAAAQNLPDYRHFSSEEDHRRALEACRLQAKRTLDALVDGDFHNVRKQYRQRLEYYLADVPKTAGAGNILLANDDIRILHGLFLADKDVLREAFAIQLKSVIANQFALNDFYDLVQRHNEAVTAGSWTQPFPLDAAKGFFGAVENNTPRWFVRDVEHGLRQVEEAEPPGVAVESERAPESEVQPSPLPPGTPDAQDSWKRQMATAANALWETFLLDRNMPVDKDEWRKAAQELGVHVAPIIDFLREQEKGK